MKKIFLIILVAYCLPLAAQSWWWAFSDSKTWSPIDRGADLQFWFKGDAELTTSSWGDQSANNVDLTLYNTPTITGNYDGIPTVRLENANSEYGKTASVVLDQPVTIYAVIKLVTIIQDGYVWDGDNQNKCGIRGLNGVPPVLAANSGAGVNSTGIEADSWMLVTAIYNTTSSSVQINDDTPATGNIGTNDMDGLTINSRGEGNSTFADTEYAEIIVLSSIDSAEEITQIKTYLKGRFPSLPITL